MPFEWMEGEAGMWFAEPHPGARYECNRSTPKSRRYWAKFNGVYLGTKQTRIFRGDLERCKTTCEQHYVEHGRRPEDHQEWLRKVRGVRSKRSRTSKYGMW